MKKQENLGLELLKYSYYSEQDAQYMSHPPGVSPSGVSHPPGVSENGRSARYSEQDARYIATRYSNSMVKVLDIFFVLGLLVLIFYAIRDYIIK